MIKNYNYLRRRLLIPEYGRHIQEMVDALLEIEDRNERTRQAQAVIAVMGNINPTLRDTADFAHKLWDHLFIMSEFRLDVDSPYTRPSREDLEVKPEKLAYSQGNISHKHYGKNIKRVLQRLGEEYDKADIEVELENATRYLRNKSMEYNQEIPSNDTLINDIKIMSSGAIEVNEEMLKKFETKHKSASLQQKATKTKGANKGKASSKSHAKGNAKHK